MKTENKEAAAKPVKKKTEAPSAKKTVKAPTAKKESKKEAEKPKVPLVEVVVIDKEMEKKLQLAEYQGVTTADSLVVGEDIIQKIAGDKFKVEEMGLSLAKGAEEPSLDNLKMLFVGFGKTQENMDHSADQSRFMQADAYNLAEKIYGEEGANALEQAIPLGGKTKHTFNQARNVANGIPAKMRSGSLSFTHHKTLYEYSRVKNVKGEFILTQKDFPALIKWAEEGEKAKAYDSASKKVVTVWEPKTCQEFREHLQVLTGKASKPKPEKEEEDSPSTEPKKGSGYLYIETDSKKKSIIINHSSELSTKALEYGMAVISLEEMVLLDSSGAEAMEVSSLGDEWFVEDKKEEEGDGIPE